MGWYLVIALSIFLCYGFADSRTRICGADLGMSVFMRLSTFLLICIGVQIVWNGVAPHRLGLSLH